MVTDLRWKDRDKNRSGRGVEGELQKVALDLFVRWTRRVAGDPGKPFALFEIDRIFRKMTMEWSNEGHRLGWTGKLNEADVSRMKK